MKLKSIEGAVTGEMAKCDFCTDIKPVTRHYLRVANKHFSDDEKGCYSKYIKYCAVCGMKEDRQHLIQTIRKEVEGMKVSEDCDEICDGYCYSWGCNSSERRERNKTLSDILTLLTTLEEEVSK